MRFDVNLAIMKITHVDREVDSRSKMSFSAMYGSWREIEHDAFYTQKYRGWEGKLAISTSFVLRSRTKDLE
ncbi:hypothetical protein FR275_06770 [Vibrio cholerae]|nr:hypothetical protein [Vibrio cholerae]